MKFVWSVLAFFSANAVGLLIAILVLSGFVIDPLSFLLAVAIFSVVQAGLGPLVTKVSQKKFPQLMGGIALVTIFIGLFVTDLLMEGMQIGGIGNWLSATLLVWIGSLIASILLPKYVFKQLGAQTKTS